MCVVQEPWRTWHNKDTGLLHRTGLMTLLARGKPVNDVLYRMVRLVVNNRHLCQTPHSIERAATDICRGDGSTFEDLVALCQNVTPLLNVNAFTVVCYTGITLCVHFHSCKYICILCACFEGSPIRWVNTLDANGKGEK